MAETTASEAMTMEPSEAGTRESGPVATSSSSEGVVDTDAPLEVEVEEIPVVIPRPSRTGFQAFLQHANLHNLLQIEGLSRTTGVFLVASQGRRGYLHLSNGELIHAETDTLTGEPAAAEILSWGDGEFKSCDRPLAAAATILVSLQALLLRLARDSDEAAQSERRVAPAPVGPRPVEEDKPTEPHLPAPNLLASAADPRRSSSAPPAPRSSRLPPPLPPRIERDPSVVTEVTISAAGEMVQGRGIGPDEFSARVAYAARLADLIGRAIRSGTPRALELHGKGTHTNVKWQADGTLAASLELVQSPKLR